SRPFSSVKVFSIRISSLSARGGVLASAGLVRASVDYDVPILATGLVRRVMADVITPNRGTFLSFGILGTIWAASGGFSAAIEALNIAYDVDNGRTALLRFVNAFARAGC